MFYCEDCGACSPEACACVHLPNPRGTQQFEVGVKVRTVGELLDALSSLNPNLKLTKPVTLYAFDDRGHGGWQARVMEV